MFGICDVRRFILKVIVDFATYGSLIEFDPFLGDDIELYQKAFEEWYYEESQGGRLLRQRSDLKYTTFGVDVIIDWIKEVSPNSNPVVLERLIEFPNIDRNIPALYF